MSPRGRLWPCKCKPRCPAGQPLIKPGCSVHPPRTLSAPWTTPPRVHRHAATPPLDPDTLQRQPEALRFGERRSEETDQDVFWAQIMVRTCEVTRKTSAGSPGYSLILQALGELGGSLHLTLQRLQGMLRLWAQGVLWDAEANKRI